MRRGAQEGIEVGQLLILAKVHVAPKAWLGWLRDMTSIQPRMAQIYMRLAAHADELNTKQISHPTINGMLSALAKPKPEPTAAAQDTPNNKPPLKAAVAVQATEPLPPAIPEDEAEERRFRNEVVDCLVLFDIDLDELRSRIGPVDEAWWEWLNGRIVFLRRSQCERLFTRAKELSQ